MGIQSLYQRLGLSRSGASLSRREKRVLAFGALFFVLFVVIVFVVSPVQQARSRLQKSLVNKEATLQRLVELQGEYRRAVQRAGRRQPGDVGRGPGMSLFSSVESQAAAAGVKAQIQYMKPSVEESDGPYQQSLIDMKVQQISLGRLVDFLTLLQAPELGISTRRLVIQDSDSGSKKLDLTLRIATLVEKQ